MRGEEWRISRRSRDLPRFLKRPGAAAAQAHFPASLRAQSRRLIAIAASTNRPDRFVSRKEFAHLRHRHHNRARRFGPTAPNPFDDLSFAQGAPRVLEEKRPEVQTALGQTGRRANFWSRLHRLHTWQPRLFYQKSENKMPGRRASAAGYEENTAHRKAAAIVARINR